MPVSPTQVALLVSLAIAFGFVYYYEGRGRWRSLVEDRFIYGVPWGTLVTVGIVVAFYLLAQGGLRNWDAPVIFAFISWSYLYPLGVLTAGIAHANPAHIVSNMTGTLLLAPIAEYAWSHYRPSGARGRGGHPSGGRSIVTDGGVGGLLDRPWVRAVVVFPAALLAVALLTSMFSLGPGLGFSGAVFAIFGFAVVNYPVTTVLAVLGSVALRTVYTALTTPVVRAGIETGPPSPPAWASIGFQAHLLGFLVGVLAGAVLLSRRNRRPALERVFFATFLLGMAQSLWLLVWTENGTFVLYRGAGVAFVALLTVVVTVAVAGSDRSIPKPLSVLSRRPTRRQLAVVWLVLLSILAVTLAVGIVIADEVVGLQLGALAVIAVLLALPALPPVLPRRILEGPLTRRGGAALAIVALTLVVAAVGVPFSLIVVGEDAVPGDSAVAVGDYQVTYAENATSGQEFLLDVPENETEVAGQELTGVFVVSDAREMWTVGVRGEILAHSGNDTVVVGSAGWREEIAVNRTGWEVVGNETVYAVDLTADGETTRSYTADAVRANVRVDGHDITVAPDAEGFQLRVYRGDERVGETTIPPVGETATANELRFETRPVDDTVAVFVVTDGTDVQLAQRETYS